MWSRNTGFLRYWTVSNLPNFLLASPLLFLLTKSGFDYAKSTVAILRSRSDDPKHRMACLVGSIAVAQLVLVLMTFTSYHVQIITRISSGYPLWYLGLAERLASEKGTRSTWGRNVVMFMVMYAMVQGVLFASFLPPA
jgi:phosphatidylinositol glycan class V